ncbi:hypothetical protein HNQ34_001954 [Anoxybacillus tepidamans]|uniref:Uncharacterized protein n=1 Tax=Anoxybacteroides tepidamans TaxID=265948 RepID=A0A7W8IS02_9BACL|nr:hypothetical protein [Anoxybacillus tepidamans]
MFTDTAFVNHQTHDQMIAGAKAKGFHDLAEDLEREIIHIAGARSYVCEQRFFGFIWLIEAVKQ